MWSEIFFNNLSDVRQHLFTKMSSTE